MGGAGVENWAKSGVVGQFEGGEVIERMKVVLIKG